jgi:hypothetical protein
MALQDIIDTASNIEVNRSKLVAQTISRSGRISTASRNWANPFRFTVTPKPVWSYTEYQSIFESIFNNDRYLPSRINLTNYDATTGALTATGMSWLTEYQGDLDTNDNGSLDNTTASSAQGTRIIITLAGSPTANDYIYKQGDYTRLAQNIYPYIVTDDIKVPTVATGITGIITAAGVITVSNGITNTTTTTTTTITSVSSTAGLTVGQTITRTSGAGAFGGITYIKSIDSATQITIISTTACTAGAITFAGSATSVAIPIHRGYLDYSGYTVAGQTVRCGRLAASFTVMVVKLPQIRFLPGKLVEFTGDFELVEEIL